MVLKLGQTLHFREVKAWRYQAVDDGDSIGLTNAHPLDHLQRLQARMPITTDNDVIMHLNAELARDLDDLFGHLDVRARRVRVAARMIVHEASARLIELIPLGSSTCRG
jgi:hypothetical protein